MGYGPITPGGKQLPITPLQGSWVQQEQARKLSGVPPVSHNLSWPLGMNAKGVYVETNWKSSCK